MPAQYNEWLVALSYVVAVIASYVALSMATRVAASKVALTARYWLCGGSVAMGAGIWSMHFVGMLSFSLPIPVPYSVPVTLLSLVFAIGASGIALHTISRGKLSYPRLLTAGVVMGSGIGLMHYTGMVALQIAPRPTYDPTLFILSIAIAIAASIAAMWICFQLKSDTGARALWKKSASALVMGLAIWGMHFTGMAAANFAANSYCLGNPQAIDNEWLAITVTVCTFLFLAATMLISLLDAKMTERHDSLEARRTREIALAGERLQASEAQYRLLFDNNPRPMWVYDVETLRFAAVNNAAVEHYGYTRQQFLGMTIRDIRPAEDVDKLEKDLERLPDQRKVFSIWRHRTQDGSIIDVEISSDGIVFDGRPARMVLANDVTERKHSEMELLRMNRALKMLSASNEALIRADQEQQLLADICRIAVEIGGYSLALVGYAQDDASHSIRHMAGAGDEYGFVSQLKLSWSADDPTGSGPTARALRGSEVIVVEDMASDPTVLPWRTLIEKRSWRSVVCLPLMDDQRAFGVLTLIADKALRAGDDEVKLLQEMAHNMAFGIASIRLGIDRQRMQAAALTQAQRLEKLSGAEAASEAKSQFLAAMSHEIRTPMNGILGILELVERESPSGEQRESLGLARESALSLLRVIDDILDFSKIEAGRIDIESLPLSVEDVMEGVAEILNSRAGTGRLKLACYVDPAIPGRVSGDELRLRQTLLNLCGNAIKFTDRGRVLMRADRVEDAQGGTRVLFRVIDTGIGIAQDLQAALFSPFAQAEASTTRRFGGSGLGLSISRGLVKRMGGTIGLKSEPGVGSEFWFELPFSAAPEEGGRGNDKPLDGIRVAVSLSESDEGDMLGHYLEAAGATLVAPGTVHHRDEHDSPYILIHDRKRGADTGYGEHGFVLRRAESPPAQGVTLSHPLKRRLFIAEVVALARNEVGDDSGSAPFTNSTVAAPAAQRSAARILVAEDNLTNQYVIRRQLDSLGYTAEIATDGAQALELLSSGDFALLLADMHMPRLDGLDLTREIRRRESAGERHGHLHIVALTASAVRGEAERCLAAGMDAYLSKPVSLDRLKVELDRWIPHAVVTDETPALDVHVLPQLMGTDDPTILRSVLITFVRVNDEGERKLGLAVEQVDDERVGLLAHDIRGAARTIGAGPLAAAADALEMAAQRHQSGDFPLMYRRLSAECERLRACIADLATAGVSDEGRE